MLSIMQSWQRVRTQKIDRYILTHTRLHVQGRWNSQRYEVLLRASSSEMGPCNWNSSLPNASESVDITTPEEFWEPCRLCRLCQWYIGFSKRVGSTLIVSPSTWMSCSVSNGLHNTSGWLRSSFVCTLGCDVLEGVLEKDFGKAASWSEVCVSLFFTRASYAVGTSRTYRPPVVMHSTVIRSNR